MYRISVTTLEKFRRYMADTSSYDTEAALIETLSGTFEGNDKTKTGSAFHKIIEDPSSATPVKKDNKLWLVSENIAFPSACAEKALSFRNQHPLLVYEIPVGKIYRTKKYEVKVTGRIDSIEGKHIRDAKTKYRAPSDLTDYTDSCQWMFYLDIIGLKVFHFDIFEVKRFKELKAAEDGICYLEGIDIVYHDPITCLAYLTMNEYLHYLVEQFMIYIEFRNLFHLLKLAENESVKA